MDKKEAFIKIVQTEIFDKPDIYAENYSEGLEFELAKEFFEELKRDTTKPKNIITENGLKVLTFMYENKDKYNNIFKSKEIGEGLFISGHAVSGSMRKLIIEGFVEKIGKDPITYSITNKGFDYIAIRQNL